jgi:hypothetical protein
VEEPDGERVSGDLPFGELLRVPFEGEALVRVTPASGVDVGAGRGEAIERRVGAGMVGLVIDTRGRPLTLPEDRAERLSALERWSREMDGYPEN